MSEKKLIVAADDFGLTNGVNDGIVRAAGEGIVTSLNFLPAGEAFGHALKLAKETGLKEAGAHLALTEMSPVADVSKVPSLVGAGGRFYGGHFQFMMKFISGAISRDEVYLEWRSQLDRAAASGIRITNLSSHEHLHMIPDLLAVMVRLAKEYSIPAIRYPHRDRSSRKEDFGSLVKKAALTCFESNVGKTLQAAKIIAPEHFLGFLDSGNITEEVLLGIIEGLEYGTTELVCHPGFLDKRVLDHYTFHKNSEAELFALTSRRVKKAIEDNKIKLESYSGFITESAIKI